MPEIPGSVTIIPAPIETVLMSVAEECLLFFIAGVVITVLIRIHCWWIQKKIDAIDARLRRGMTE